MAERVRELLIPELIKASIKQHTRRGIRAGCDCNWCIEKKVGTAYIGRTFFPTQRYNERVLAATGETPVHNRDWSLYEWIAEQVVKEERERKRKIVRERLKIAKEEVL